MKREEAIKRMKAQQALCCVGCMHPQEIGYCENTCKLPEAYDMAIEALSKPNYESDTEVRLAVTERNKDKIVLWDAFGEQEYYPNGEINCVHCPHYYETEDDTGVHGHCGGGDAEMNEVKSPYMQQTPNGATHGRLIDADALKKKAQECATEAWKMNLTARIETVLNQFIDWINDAPTVQADRPYGKWTPVTEQLPKIDETLHLCDQISDEVLGTDTYGNIRHVYLTNCGYLKPTFCTVEEGMSVDIVAWMPPPKPYKQKTERRG